MITGYIPWEDKLRFLLRIILGFVISLHGFHKLFGLFTLGGRTGNPVMAIDSLPDAFGILEVVGGLLLFLGLFARPIAAFLLIEMALAYLYLALPHGIWPVKNGGQEAAIQVLVLSYFVTAGAGTWSVDNLLQAKRQKTVGLFMKTSPP